jgi:hypothetical protein
MTDERMRAIKRANVLAYNVAPVVAKAGASAVPARAASSLTQIVQVRRCTRRGAP